MMPSTRKRLGKFRKKDKQKALNKIKKSRAKERTARKTRKVNRKK